MEPTTTTDGTNVLGFLVLGAPIIYAIIVSINAVKGTIIVGVLTMYASIILLVFIPLLGAVMSIGLFVGGLLLVAIGGTAGAIAEAVIAANRETAKNTAVTAEYFRALKARYYAQQEAETTSKL